MSGDELVLTSPISRRRGSFGDEFLSEYKISASKRAMRKRPAALPIGEQLHMLDALRERTLAIRGRKRPGKPSELTL